MSVPRSILELTILAGVFLCAIVSSLGSSDGNVASGFSFSHREKTMIRNLSVSITTNKSRGAGTDNAVYFDVGPLSWKLGKPHHNDFERGSTDTYELIRDGLILNVNNSARITITTTDILWWRLHKKGLAGVTGLGDGFDGAWRPSIISLIINGVESPLVTIDEPLTSRCWFWRSKDPDDSDLRTFARSLRLVPNKSLNSLDKASGILTTNLFKKRGISGWLSDPVNKECTGKPPYNPPSTKLPPLCVTGSVLSHATSSDGLETIDLRVALIQAADADTKWQPSEIRLDNASGFDQPRYLRVESPYAHHRVHKEQTVRICGELRWDTDREGWWEIHPRNSADLPSAAK